MTTTGKAAPNSTIQGPLFCFTFSDDNYASGRFLTVADAIASARQMFDDHDGFGVNIHDARIDVDMLEDEVGGDWKHIGSVCTDTLGKTIEQTK